MLSSYLTQAWLWPKHIDIYIALVQHGKATATYIASQLGRERTSTFKLMKQMSTQGRLASTKEFGSTYFIPVDLHTIQQQFDTKLQKLQTLHEEFDLIQQEYNSLQSNYTRQTTVTLQEWAMWVSAADQRIIQIIQDTWLKQITCIANNTFKASSAASPEMKDGHKKFVKQISEQWVYVRSMLWVGTSTMEYMLISTSNSSISDLALSNNAAQIRIVWADIFVYIYQKTPHVIHIGSPHLADLLHFVADQLERIDQ